MFISHKNGNLNYTTVKPKNCKVHTALGGGGRAKELTVQLHVLIKEHKKKDVL